MAYYSRATPIIREQSIKTTCSVSLFTVVIVIWILPLGGPLFRCAPFSVKQSFYHIPLCIEKNIIIEPSY